MDRRSVKLPFEGFRARYVAEYSYQRNRLAVQNLVLVGLPFLMYAISERSFLFSDENIIYVCQAGRRFLTKEKLEKAMQLIFHADAMNSIGLYLNKRKLYHRSFPRQSPSFHQD